VHTAYPAWADDVLQDAIGLEEYMLAVVDLYLVSRNGIDEGQLGQSSVEEARQGLHYLSEGRPADEHRMEHAVCRVGLGVLSYASAGERPVAYVHREEAVVHSLPSVHRQHHMLRLMLRDGGDESEEVVHVVRTYIVLERLGLLAAERIDAEADGVDEIAMMLDAVAPVGEAAYVDRMWRALEETSERVLMLLGESPVASPVVACTAWHESHLYLGPLVGGDRRSHDAVDGLAECAVTAEYQQFVVAAFHQFACQLYGMSGIFGHAVGERLMTPSEQVPEVDALPAKSPLA